MIQANQTLLDVAELSVDHALQDLATIIKAQPAFVNFVQAYQAMQADEQTQRLLDEARALQVQMRYGYNEERATRLDELLVQIHRQLTFLAYQKAEQDLRALLHAVDAVIGEAAGVDFAANAKRSCCGG